MLEDDFILYHAFCTLNAWLLLLPLQRRQSGKDFVLRWFERSYVQQSRVLVVFWISNFSSHRKICSVQFHVSSFLADIIIIRAMLHGSRDDESDLRSFG